MQHLTGAMCFLATLTLISDVAVSACAAEIPTNNPVATFYEKTPEAMPPWIGDLPWDRGVSIADFKGDNDARLAAAQKSLGGKGGVVFFPAGDYDFKNDLVLEDGVVLRGANPKGDAKQNNYQPGTRFEFVKYRPSMKGSGTPIDSAFRKITLKDAVTFVPASTHGLPGVRW